MISISIYATCVLNLPVVYTPKKKLLGLLLYHIIHTLSLSYMEIDFGMVEGDGENSYAKNSKLQVSTHYTLTLFLWKIADSFQ